MDASALDFDEAEKKAREEAERKERLGYDPDEETAPAESKITASQPTSNTTIHQPTPISPPKGDYGSGSQNRQRSDSEMERLGMGVRKLGFGQIGGGGMKSAAQKPKAMGFGSTSRAPVEGKKALDAVINTTCDQSTNNRPFQTTQNATRATNSAYKKASPRTNSSAKAATTRPRNPKPKPACKASRARSPSPPTPTSAGRRTRKAAREARITAIWRRPRRISCASSASPRAMIWRICRVCWARGRRSCRALLGII